MRMLVQDAKRAKKTVKYSKRDEGESMNRRLWRAGFRVAAAAAALVCGAGGDAAMAQDGMAFGVEEVEEVEKQAATNPKLEAFLTEGRKLYGDKKYEEAALLFYKVLQDESVGAEVAHADATYELSKALFHMGLYQGALHYLGRIAETGETHPYYREALHQMLLLSQVIPGNELLLDHMAQYAELFPQAVTLKHRDRYAYLVGRHLYNRLELDQAIKLLSSIQPSSEYYPRAQYIKGVSHVADYDAKPAVESFKNVLRVLTAKDDNGSLEREERELMEMANLAMARVFYSTRSFDTSLKYYGKIPRKNRTWLSALFESSWAFFRIDQYNKALGNLLTLNSPFFADAYFPEGPILSAVIFIYNCKYRRVRDVLEDFEDDYEPLQGAISELVEKYQDPVEMLEWYRQLVRGGGEVDEELRRIVGAASDDQQLARKLELIETIDRERQRYERLNASLRNSALGSKLEETLDQEQGVAKSEAGNLITKRLTRVVSELQDLVLQKKSILFEVARAEKGEIDADVRSEMVTQTQVTERPDLAVSDEELFWVFDGEYWKDELGYYHFNVNTECKR